MPFPAFIQISQARESERFFKTFTRTENRGCRLAAFYLLDADKLRQTLTEAITNKVDVIFTCGGTGLGPRDCTPETVESVSDKMIPGIMENIRIKYGKDKLSVLLSRSVAAIAGTTQIYTLPGSVRAVEEYLYEVLKTLDHAILMIHGINAH